MAVVCKGHGDAPVFGKKMEFPQGCAGVGAVPADRPEGKFCHGQGNGQVWHLPHVWSERGGKAPQKDENYPMLAPLCQQMCIVLGLDLI